MLTLRNYQSEAIDAVFDYWQEEAGNPLVDLATGCGKSLVMASLIQRLVEGWPDMRVMVVTHVAELIEQNYLELLGVWPFAPAGIYSAGLGRRDARSQIVFAGIQTVHNKAKQIGHIDVLMVDECHLIPINSNTMYRKFIDALLEINQDMKILGLTATPYRLDTGRLDEGADRLFDQIVYTYGVADGIRDGFLAPLTSKPTATEYDVNGVGRLGGDYKQRALEEVINRTDLNDAVVSEIIAKGNDRRSWLCFCAGVKAALDVRDVFRSRGITCEAVTGDTPKEERRRILEDFKAYRIQCVTNNSVLTTGFNHKGVDLIAFMRPTLSLSLYVQMAGRGTRPLYKPGAPLDTVEDRLAAISAGPKRNCLVLDFAKLVDRHGPVDMVEPKAPSAGNGEPPIKICPTVPDDSGAVGCGEKVHISLMKCPCCGYDFPPNEDEKLTRQAADVPIVSTAEAEWRKVTGRTFHFHEGKGDKPPSVKCSYIAGYTQINEWLCPQHSGFAQTKAHRWWTQHGGQRPFPKTVMEWLERQRELLTTDEISVVPNGKYWNVKDVRPGLSLEADNDNSPEPANDNVSVGLSEMLDDEIPF
jgi:DNA repair protein RadD